MAIDLDDDSGVDDLYTGPPNDFVAARDRLAKELRRAGDNEGARRVKKLRKPTLAAWALNVVARRDADEIDELRHVGAQVRAAQEATLTGEDSSGLKASADRRRAIIRRIADEAGDLVPEGHHDEIVETLDAASIDEDVGEQLQKGRLAKARRPSPGFAGFSDLFTGAPSTRRGRSEKDRSARRRLKSRLDRADRAVERSRDRLQAARSRLSDAERAVEKAEGTVRSSERKRDDIAAELESL